MSDLDPMLADLLRSACEELGPTEAETHRLRRRLQRKMAVGGAVVVGSVLATKGAKAGGMIALVTAKLGATVRHTSR